MKSGKYFDSNEFFKNIDKLGNFKERNVFRKMFYLYLFALLIIGSAVIWTTARNASIKLKENLKKEARIIAGSIDYDHIKLLKGNASDTSMREFKMLKANFSRLFEVMPNDRYIYLLGLRDGKVFFYVDSEPKKVIESKDGEVVKELAIPGEIYDESSDLLKNVFRSKKDDSEGPLSDKWGEWVSVFVPIINPENNDVIAVLGVDVDVHEWNLLVFKECALPIGLILLALFLLFSSYFLGMEVNSTRNFALHIKNSEEKFRQMFMHHGSVMILVDSETGNVVDANLSALNFYGYTRDQLLQMNMSQINYMDEDAIWDLRRKVLSFELNNFVIEQKMSDGSIRIVEVYSSPFDTSDKKLIFAVVIDISERIKMEMDLLESKQIAEKANQAKSDFLANMSHEIRTPLNGVIGFTELLLKTTLSDVQKNYLQTVQLSANSLLDLLNDILDFSKIEAGKLDLYIEKVDFYDLIEDLVDVIKYKVEDKNVELLIDIQPNIPRIVEMDPVRVRQVLLNLLFNAVKFTDEGEIILKVEMKESDRLKKEFTFSVIDTGIGISEDKQKQIFDSFSQADNSTTRKYGGTGLGLSISESLVSKMGSGIQLESKSGFGSKFFFSVLLNTENRHWDEDISLTGIKEVLVVDDNATNRRIVDEMLKLKNISVDKAAGGEAALEMLQSKVYDIIIVDYHMPGMDGLELIRMIREEKRTMNTQQPIMFLHSSSNQEFLKAECDRLNVQIYMVKPVKLRQLYKALELIKNENSGSLYERATKKEEPLPSKIFTKHTFLVIDDNVVNLTLLIAYIQEVMPNAEIVEAYNGKDAYELFKKCRPSMVFMDVQMPVMNGYEATRKIREYEMETGGNTPIVAITAGIEKGEEERCKEAGMNDYISKPVLLNRLIALMHKYLKTTIEPVKTETPVVEKKVETVSVVEAPLYEGLVHFNKEKMMDRVMDNEELFQKMMKLAYDSLQKMFESLQLAIEEKDCEKIKSVAHAIKGVALNASFEILTKMARELELNCKENSDTEQIKSLHASMYEEFRLLLDLNS